MRTGHPARLRIKSSIGIRASQALSRFIPTFSRFRSDARGNSATIFAFAMAPMLALVGMGVDYTLAGRRKALIDAYVDAAVLSTTTPGAMALTPAKAQTNAIAMFNAQVNGLNGVTYAPANLSLVVNDVTAASGTLTRTTTATYNAKSQNAFSALLNMPTINIAGTSAVSNSNAPNIDFYLLLDTSPSMGIPSSQSGIDTMVQNTQQQGGCAFACHETNPTTGDTQGNPNNPATGRPMDNYALARKLGLTLRIDLVQQATAQLYQTAATTEAANKAVYRVATYSFDQSFYTITNLTTNLTQAQNDANTKINMLQVYSNGSVTSNNANNDEDTQLDSALSNTPYIPNPGNGTNKAGDTPQEILFLVTDGVIDEAYPGYGSNDMTSGGRTITKISHQYDYCTPLKARGVRIAVLYTTYNPLPTNGFYNTYIAPFQSTIPTALMSCASPGLFFQVDTGGDIAGAMQTLFSKVIATAHLIQ